MTEVEDLETVLETVKKWGFVDLKQIYLCGRSQGGVVSAIVGARHKEEVAGLILLYPAFVIMDQIHELFSSIEEVPRIYSYLEETLGYVYASDIWEYDPYREIGRFSKPVLLLHGTKDILVPIIYSERAKEVYRKAELYLIEGGEHGFSDQYFVKAVKYIERFLKKQIDEL